MRGRAGFAGAAGALILCACGPVGLGEGGSTDPPPAGMAAAALDVEVLLERGALPGHAVDLATGEGRIVVAVGRAVVELAPEQDRPPAPRCALPEPILQLALGEGRAFAITGGGASPYECPLAGAEAAPISPALPAASADPFERARGLAADGDELFWITVGSAGVRRLYRAAPSATGLAAEELCSFQGDGDPGVIHLALDDTSVHWADAAVNTIHRAPRAGGEVSWIRVPDVITTQIALDDDFIYWASWGSIYRMPSEGGAPEEVIAARPDTERVWALAVDGGFIHWGGRDLRDSFIRRAPKDAPGSVEEIWGDGDCWEGEMQLGAGSMSWVCVLGRGAVYRAR